MVVCIDIKDVKENPEKYKDSERRRFKKEKNKDANLVDKALAAHETALKATYDREQQKKLITQQFTKVIAQRKKDSKGQDPCAELIADQKKAEDVLEALEKAEAVAVASRDKLCSEIGNPLDPTVPTSLDEDGPTADKDPNGVGNQVVATWGTPRTFTEKYGTNGFRPHFELIEMIGGVNFEAGRDVAGDRAYFLMGPAVLLNQAMINYGLAFLMKNGGYTPIQPPFFMNADVMGQAAELADYDEVLYKITDDRNDGAETGGADKYMIATSEQPITALHRGKVIDRSVLPIRYAGTSSCFRKEAGSSGRDIRGTFRVHQFEKVEQFVICEGSESKEQHEAMIGQAAAFYQSLELPYHVVNIASGAMNDAAAKKYDLEAWFPGDKDGKGQFRELVSCSNCLEYQSRRMNTRANYLTSAKDVKKEEGTIVYPHMLNSTLTATERAMCCILENYQTKEGIRVPRVLVPYMAGMEFIPFVKAPPKGESAPKKKK